MPPASESHHICLHCWRYALDRTRKPYGIAGLSPAICCWCGAHTSAGVRIRWPAHATPCKGEHKKIPLDGLKST